MNKVGIIALSFLMLIIFSVQPARSQEDNAVPSLCVEGIIYDAQDSSAIVNGTPVRIGNNIKGAVITAITDSSVTFDYNGNVFSKGVNDKCTQQISNPQATTQSVVSKKETSAPLAVKKGVSEAREEAKPLYSSSKQYGTSYSRTYTESEMRKIKSFMAGSMTVVFLFFLVLYAYSSFVVQKIAQKTNTSNGWLAWVPIANVFLLCSIAGKSFLWILILFVPFAGIIIFTLVIWGGIAEACGKSWWLGLLLFVPIVSLIFVSYLAFSKMETAPVSDKPLPEDPLQKIARPEKN
ncbi:MAG: DUF5684 domain-containing protein [Candidatus Omnitrophica bacterium]|nr:DUF5684 domain-containing protein [Candidatus Omnitrophota bacterium]